MTNIFTAWHLKTIQEALNIHRQLMNSGKTWGNVAWYINKGRGAREKEQGELKGHPLKGVSREKTPLH